MATYSDDQLNDIFDRTGGFCHLCSKKLCWGNYGCFGARGCWEVDHSAPCSTGGSHGLGNWLPACVSCNRKKRARSTRSARRQNGRTSMPPSKRRRQEKRSENTVAGGLLGAGAALAIGLGPVGIGITSVLGAAWGSDWSVDE